jgi:hypothetical protein
MVENNRIVLLMLLQVMLILLSVNHIIYAQQPVLVMDIILLKIGDKNFPISYTIVESKVFGNFSKGPINNNVSLTRALLGNITHIDAVPHDSKLMITTNSSIGIALTLEIPKNVITALTNNVGSKAVNQATGPVSVNGQQTYALICPNGDVTKVFIPSISSHPHIITLNLNPNIFQASPGQTCSGIA